LESVNPLPESFDPGVEHQRRRERHPAGALNRKNWIHFVNQDANPHIAAILSIVETCRRLQILSAIISLLSCPV
jgi:hypothetical protein